MVSPQNISSYLRKPYELDSNAEQALREIIKQYPYFNNAWLLLARSLHNQQSPLFSDALKQASVFAGNRALLYKLVNIDDAEAEIPGTIQIASPPATPTNVTVDAPVVAEPAKEEFVVEAEEPPVGAGFESVTFDEPQPQTTTEELPSADVPVAEPIENNTNNHLTSAYDDIFGTPTTAHDDIVADFETFHIETDHSSEAEHDFALSIDEDEQIINTESSEETFELNVADNLDTDGDGIIAPAPNEETSEETFELNTFDEIAQVYESEKETTHYHLGDEFVFEDTSFGDIAVEEVDEKVNVVENEPDANVTEPEAEPIAFKLNRKEENTEAPQEQEETGSVLMAPTTFYEWLEQLKTPVVGDEKKNETTPTGNKPVAETKTLAIAVEEPAPVAPKKSSVDEIINRFISINPTISRPKAEFYNPAAKSKESDTPDDDLATETLAKIYRSQNLTEKAIGIYERLIKLYPSKAGDYHTAINEIKNQTGH